MGLGCGRVGSIGAKESSACRPLGELEIPTKPLAALPSYHINFPPLQPGSTAEFSRSSPTGQRGIRTPCSTVHGVSAAGEFA